MTHLPEHHRRMLIEESGIDPTVVEERGYRSIEKKAQLKERGFSDAQRSVPGLLAPIWGVQGEIVNYQYRPDQPRTKDGRVVKYEVPPGARMVLDVHPSNRDHLQDPAIPLFVTEGMKKGDSMTSRGLCAVTLLGVWNWRGTNCKGGRVALPEWELVALNSRRAFIVFDSDVMLKPGVHLALTRLKEFLEGRGAEVAVIYLPHGEGGAKQGVDDFFVAGHGADDLLSLAATELREPPEGEDPADEPYTQSAKLVNYAAEADLFRTPDGEAYASVPVEED